MSQLADDFRLHACRNLDESKFEFVLQQSDLALAFEPEANDLLAFKAEALLGLERYDEALGIATRLVHQNADSAAYWLLLCRALRGLGYEDLALRTNAYAADHFASDFETDRFRGDTLFASERFEEANAAYETTLQRFGQKPQAWEIWYNSATCLKNLGRQSEARDADRHALRLLQQLLALGESYTEKQHAALLSSLGILYFRLNQFAQAERAFSDSFVVSGHGAAAYWYAQTLRAQGKKLGVVLTLPWVLRNSWNEDHGRRTMRSRMLKQRAVILPDTIQHIESLIS